jgi:hypothetical protein
VPSHEFYNELKSAGFNEQQAEVIANIQGKTASMTFVVGAFL